MARKILLLSVCLSCLGITTAQPSRGIHPLPASQIAGKRTEMMEKELGLTEKQRDKVYRINLRQAEKRQQQAAAQQSPDMGDGGPGGGMHPGRGMHGGMGGPGSGGGMGRPGGSMSGPGGNMDRGSMPGSSPRMEGQRPDRPMPAAGDFYEESEKDVAQREKKMKKILSAEQYSKWSDMEKEHRRHEMREQLNRSIMPPAE